MSKISIADIHPQIAATFMDELTYAEMKTTIGGRLSWEQVNAMDEKMYNLRVHHYRLMDNLSDRLDQEIYNEVMGWELPNNI